MITLDHIKNGISAGVVKFIVDPNMGAGTVCQIGDNWFYFGGDRAESMNPDEYLKTVPGENVAEAVHGILTDFAKSEDFFDEYHYYKAILEETGIIT